MGSKISLDFVSPEPVTHLSSTLRFYGNSCGGLIGKKSITYLFKAVVNPLLHSLSFDQRYIYSASAPTAFPIALDKVAVNPARVPMAYAFADFT